MTTNIFNGFSETLLNEDGAGFGFVCIWRRGDASNETARYGVTVRDFLADPANQSGEWLIDGGWGGPPGPIIVRWRGGAWENGGFGGRQFID